MKTGLAQDTTNSAKNLAQQIAKQMRQEPIEILKDVKEQTFGEGSPSSEKPQESQNGDQKKMATEQGKVNDQLKSSRRMEALNRELDDIHKQERFAYLQKRISGGEQVALEEYPELSMDQKQVLKAQMEAVQMQITRQQDGQTSGQLVEPATKKGRQLFNFGKKTAVMREQTHVEKPVPPSG